MTSEKADRAELDSLLTSEDVAKRLGLNRHTTSPTTMDDI